MANGIVSTSGYMPNVPFDLYVQAGARENATNAANTDLLVFHGSTDAPPWTCMSRTQVSSPMTSCTACSPAT